MVDQKETLRKADGGLGQKTRCRGYPNWKRVWGLREVVIPARFSFARPQPRPPAPDNKRQKMPNHVLSKKSTQIPKLFRNPADNLNRILREGRALSNIGITTNLLTKVTGLPSAANEFVTDLNQLAHDLKSGDIAAIEADYVLFSEAVLASTSNIGVTTALNSSPDSAATADGVPAPAASSGGSEGPAPSLNLQA